MFVFISDKLGIKKRVISKIKRTFHNYAILYQEAVAKEVVKWKFIPFFMLY